MRVAPHRLLFFLFLALLPLLLLHPLQGQEKPTPLLAVSIIDVGQGDAILVQFPTGQNMLVDAGDRAHGSTVVKYLKSRKVSRIDILVATHPHEDHIGGMEAVLSAFPIGKVWDSGYAHGSKTQENFYQTIKRKQIRFGMPRAGFTEQIGHAQIAVLAPGKNLLKGTESDANNNSLVLRIAYKNVSFLLTGDMQSEERATVATWPASTVLKVSHHGSHNGTDATFLDQVSPAVAVISCAEENSYGHPHRETLEALSEANIKTFCTATDGTVLFSTDGSKRYVQTLGQHEQARDAGQGIQSTTPAPATGNSYIGNRNSKIFHRPSCGTLPAEQNRVYFNSRDAATTAGYRPCKKCSP